MDGNKQPWRAMNN